ncbi:MAG TPA: PAS domain S-box protein [Methanospirillum sp.]|uniref:hybrid sensor histidine kinase/response regulator n=1 Tax=Methanospirillum sp. TaxID=45200 RepID=UPI002BDA0274|nr:PAS domain S-box protein [Methanospirillum sp.]HWQ64719.1 PAS domain S-box protein [Methanospirillum sp.]
MISVLHVDDERGLLEAVKLSLEDTGACIVDTAESAELAIEMFRSCPYDAIISDYAMSGTNGIDLLRQVRTEFGDIPFILYTIIPREDVLIEAINYGVTFYLQKGTEQGLQTVELVHVIDQAVTRRIAEQALKESESRYRTIIENIIDVYYRTDSEGTLVYISPSVLSILGYDSLEEVLGRKNGEFWKLPSERDILMDLLKEKKEIRDYEVTLLTRTGDDIQVAVSLRICVNEKGEFDGVEGIFRDISVRKKIEYELRAKNLELEEINRELSGTLEELTLTQTELAERNKELLSREASQKRSAAALKRANKQLNLLSSITRHDILNQITALNGYLTLIRDEIRDGEATKYLDKLELVAGTIETQIAFTRVYQDLGSQDPQWLDVKNLIPHATLSGLTLIESNLNEIKIFADPIAGKVFENLFDNTIRHGGKVSRIEITAREQSGHLIITWEDNGIGIPTPEKELIFNRGYGKNTGLGLFLVREILSITGISIREIGIEQKGAIFEISIPKGGYQMEKTNVDA